MCAEASTVLRAVAEYFFFNCWCLKIPSDNRIRQFRVMRLSMSAAGLPGGRVACPKANSTIQLPSVVF
jgi:hypothetical protein